MRKRYQGSLDEKGIFENNLIVDGNYVQVPEPTQYEQRFKFFSKFYETIKGEPYPLSAKQQYELQHFPEQDLLILGLNSAWKLNHDQHYKSCASINNEAVTNALNKINENPAYKNSRLKIAVWHHPLNSPFEDRIKDHDFMQRLAQNGFRLALHGHIHQAGADDYRYRRGSQIDIIAAGTFGAPVREWVPGYPLQYNLLKWQDNKLTVYTRKRIQLNGAWQPDAMWQREDGMGADAHYELELYPKQPSSQLQPQQPIQNDPSKSGVKRDQVFISYSHNDKKWLDKLQTMLKPMMRNNSISVWADTKIQAGAKWRDEIEKALAAANVAVLMVSQNFLASDFIANHELPPLLKAAEQEGLKIIWVPVGYCLYEETEISEYQAAHNPSQPLESLRGAALNKILVKICQEIKQAAATESSVDPQ